MPSAALAHLTRLLEARKLGATLSAVDVPSVTVASSGVALLDARLGGGWPLGAISEVIGGCSSGRTTVLVSTLAQATSQGQVAALVDAVTNDGREVDVTLPTPGFVVEPKLSMCTAAEPYIEEARRIELEQRQALAIQAGMEAKRRTRLMEGPQPSLEPFDREAAAIKVSLQQQAR